MTVLAIPDTLAMTTACHDASGLTDDFIQTIRASLIASPTFIPITADMATFNRESGLMLTLYHGGQSQVTSGKERQSIKGRTRRLL